MNKKEVRGKARSQKGRLKEAAGVVTGNRRLENEGFAERTYGAVEAALGKACRTIGDAVTGLGKAIKR
jgi:uncharacterized protein YjbJ (UPF0337 family)